MPKHKSPLCCLFAATAAFPASMTLAAPLSTTLEEVLVTAQRREESMQETPISVTAISSDTLTEIGATDVSGVSDYTPGLVITPTIGGSVNAGITIRGAGNFSNNLSRDNAVGMYLNGVPISKTSGAIFDAVDLERIEVLRGPQGTLYGKNTIGGAINLITQKPSGEWGGQLRAGIGNKRLRETRASVDLPSAGTVGEGLGEFSMRGSGFYRKRDGFYKNDGPSSDDFDNRDQWGLRFDASLLLTERFSVDYGYDRFNADQTPPMLALTNSDAFAFVSPQLNPFVAAATQTQRPDAISNDSAITSQSTVSGHTLTLHYDMPGTAIGDLSFKSITGYRDLHTLSMSDFDGTALDLFRFKIENDFDQLTQEFQLVGSTERTQYVVGLFYYEDDWYTDNPRWLFQLGGNDFDVSQRGAENVSTAVFGQLTWTPDMFDDRMDLTLGGRWTEETKDATNLAKDISIYNQDPSDPNAGVFVRDPAGNPVLTASGDLIPINADDQWREFTPMANVTWRFNDDVHGYAKVSTGFKSGGFNGVATSNAAFTTPFSPETMTGYEVGLKSRLLDQRLQLNMSVFYNDYEDFQGDRFVQEVVGTLIVNAGSASLQGMELELVARPTANLDITLNYSLLDASYDEFIGDGGVDVSRQRQFAYAPENTVFASIKYSFDPFSFGSLSARLDYYWTDDYYITIIDDPTTNVDAYSLINARIDLSDIPVGSGELRISAWGKNLSDEEYWNTAINLTAFTINQWADPRSYGLELAYRF